MRVVHAQLSHVYKILTHVADVLSLIRPSTCSRYYYMNAFHASGSHWSALFNNGIRFKPDAWAVIIRAHYARTNPDNEHSSLLDDNSKSERRTSTSI